MTSGPITRPRPGDATPVGIVRPIPNRELAGVDDLVDFGRGRRPRRGWVRVSVRIALLVAAAAVVYYTVTFVQVRPPATATRPRDVDAIVVMGAAQYDGRPSPQLAARLDHVVELWHDGVAEHVVVTGGKQPGDRFTEAEASADVPHRSRRAGVGHPAGVERAQHVRVDGGRRRRARGQRAAHGADRHRPVPRAA